MCVSVCVCDSLSLQPVFSSREGARHPPPHLGWSQTSLPERSLPVSDSLAKGPTSLHTSLLGEAADVFVAAFVAGLVVVQPSPGASVWRCFIYGNRRERGEEGGGHSTCSVLSVLRAKFSASCVRG